jgi:Cu/Ag efflux protein CusF
MNVSKTIHAAMVVFLLAFALTAVAQHDPPDAAKKSFVLRGKVEAIDPEGKKLTVNHDKVEGYMDGMTMAYRVDKPDVLKRVKLGDWIEATVRPEDYTLYNVKVVKGKK